jgi:aminobenzoyl-glutamate utilization protein B
MSPRDTALAWIAAHETRFSDFCGRIWEHAEPAWREYKSAADYVELLRAEGFAVEAGSGGMPTAFVATWGQGAPVLAGFSEYDAVPGNSQQVVPYPAPRAGLHPYAAGHTDPHSMLGTASLVAMLGAKAAMEAPDTRERLSALAVVPTVGSTAEWQAYFAAENAKWRNMIQARNIKLQ